MDARQKIGAALEAAGGAMSYAALREELSDRDVRTYSRMKAQGEIHNYWVVDGENTPAVLHVALEPTDNVYNEVPAAAAAVVV